MASADRCGRRSGRRRKRHCGNDGHAIPKGRRMTPHRSHPKATLNHLDCSVRIRRRFRSAIRAPRACPSNVCGRTRRSGSETEYPRLASIGVAATFSITLYSGPSKRISRSASALLVRSLMRMSVASSFHGMSNAFPLYSVLRSSLARQNQNDIDLTQAATAPPISISALETANG